MEITLVWVAFPGYRPTSGRKPRHESEAPDFDSVKRRVYAPEGFENRGSCRVPLDKNEGVVKA